MMDYCATRIDQYGDVEFTFGDINPYDARGFVHRVHLPRMQALATFIGGTAQGTVRSD